LRFGRRCNTFRGGISPIRRYIGKTYFGTLVGKDSDFTTVACFEGDKMNNRTQYGQRRRVRDTARRHAAISSLVLASAVCAPLVHAGDIAGVVRDPELGRFVVGASVIVAHENRRASTNRFGRYLLRDLPQGEYTISVSAGGFQPQTLSVEVPETGQVTLNIDLGTAYDDIEEIVVTSARMSQLLSLQRKRSATNIIDAVSADTVGKLPDFNAAEAIQRLPGLSVELDQGEGRYPIIRGIDSNLNNVTIDGNPVGAPEGEGRRVALDVVPSDLISVVEVVKAITPDLDGNAVGGNINIVTRSAFDSPDPFAYVSGRMGYNEKSGNIPYGASAVWGSTLGASDNFGLVLAASYYTRHYETDLVEGLDWAEFAPGAFAPANIALYDYDIERERIGFNANLEYQPNDNALWYVRSIFNEFTDHEQRDQLNLDAARGDQTALSDTVVQNSEGRATREYRQNDQTQRLINVSTGADFTRDNLEWGLSYTFSHAEEITPRRIDWEYRSAADAFPNTIDVSSLFFDLDGGTAIHDAANYDFRRVRSRTDDIEEDIHSLKADLRIDMDFGDNPGYLQFGVKYSTRDKYRDRTNENFVAGQDFTLADTGLFSSGPDDFHQGRYTLGPVMDFEAHQALLEDSPGLFEADPESSALDSILTDYDITEDMTAGYGLASVDIGNLTILGGARVEYTEADYNAFFASLPAADPLNPATPIAGSTDYLDVLPSIHLTYRPTDNIVVRGAWTNTIGRPNFQDVAPTLEVEDNEGSAGNAELEPFESMGLDLSFEYYFEPAGIASIGLFYKDIRNPIFTRRTEDVIFDGIPLEVLSQPENADGGELFGLELNLEQQFVGLPKPFDGLGASVNLTFVDSEVDVFGREADKLPFFRQPDTIGNVALFYALGQFEARIAATHRDAYLQAIGGDVTEDVYFGKRTQVDVKVTYDATENLTLFGEVQNINDASRREYQAISSRLFADELYSWTALFGASYAF
jgi:TonB-dependent receptor